MSFKRTSSYLTACVLFLLTFSAGAQTLARYGRLPSRHFSVLDFGGNAQIWTGMQGVDGRMYFGNDKSILCYNGVDWTNIEVDKKTPKNIRTLVVDSKVEAMITASDGRMYVSRTNNFGYLQYNDSGVVRYYPLKAFKNEDEAAPGQIWQIYELDNQKIYFLGKHSIYVSKNLKVERYKLPPIIESSSFHNSCRFGNGILLTFLPQGDGAKPILFYIDMISGASRIIPTPEHIEIKNIRGGFEIDGNWYVLSLEGKFFRATFNGNQVVWNSPKEVIFPELSGKRPNYIEKHGNYIYYGTETEGLIVADLHGKVYRKFDLYDELEDLNVYKIFHDKNNNLWLCLDNGIQFFETTSPITYFKKYEGYSSVAESFDFGSGEMLMGTHTDIFSPDYTDGHLKFKTSSLLGSQIFDMKTVGPPDNRQTLVVGYHGIFAYHSNRSKLDTIEKVYGYRLEQADNDPMTVFISLDDAIGKFVLRNGKWSFQEIPALAKVNINEYSLKSWKGKLYFGLDDKGVGVYDDKTGSYTVIKDPELEKHATMNFTLQVFRNELYAGIGSSFYKVDAHNKKLVTFNPTKTTFSKYGGYEIFRMVNIDDEQFWVVMYHKTAEGKLDLQSGWFVPKSGGDWEYINWPMNAWKNAGVVFTVAKGNDQSIWLGASNALLNLNLESLSAHRRAILVEIDKIEVNGKIINYNPKHSRVENALKYAQNTFKITFHSNFFSALGATEFRYRLVGFNDEWSDWSTLNYAQFQKIPEGSYALEVMARDAYGFESQPSRYEFSVLPPWYRTTLAYIIYVVLFIVLMYALVQLSTKRVKSQNQKLEDTVKERTREIAEQNTLLEQQKSEIETKTTDILDSIQYAKRIQTTILPSETRLNELVGEHFVFYRPKDIVSGDFYWAREVRENTIFGAVDCTGHGVPGSLVSIVGNNGLLRAVNEFRLDEPSDILDKLREIVVEAFRADTGDVKDGMDIALCSVNFETGLLKFSGANNECVIIRGDQMFELKPDKQPIGSFIDAKPFTQTDFQLEDGDSIYLFTDGYVDQFGGEKMKKFKSRTFKTMLSKIAHQPMKDQFTLVEKAFDDWKGETEQIDDVCVFAVKFYKRNK